MTRLIDADVLKARLVELEWITDDPFAEVGDLEEIIDDIPTVERSRGKWENDRLEKHTLHVGDCSKCGEKGVIGNFCMWCGSDNRVKEGE